MSKNSLKPTKNIKNPKNFPISLSLEVIPAVIIHVILRENYVIQDSIKGHTSFLGHDFKDASFLKLYLVVLGIIVKKI